MIERVKNPTRARLVGRCYLTSKNLVVTRAAENSRTNRIVRVICPLLPPRDFAKSLPISRMVGRGGGDRTHDLRLKRPLLYH